MAPGLKIRQEKIEEVYDVKEELGRGQFAVVKKCISKNTREQVAAKFVKVKKTKASRNGLSREMIEREAGILSTLAHEKVLKLHDVFDLGIEMCLVLELLSGGELFDKISEQEFLTEAEAGCYMKQVLEGIAYLHQKYIVHLDIKPENIVLKDKQKSDIKLVDFGLAQVIKPGDEVREMMGTPEFVAPEIVNFDCIGLYTDMWAIGVLAYILLSGCSPFLGDDNQETYANIVAIDYHFDEEYFDTISEDAKLFVEELLKKSTNKRNTAQDCLDHPWIRSMASPRSRLESSVIQTKRFKAFQARRRWQQSFQKMKAITRFSRFLKIRASSAEEPKPDDATLSEPAESVEQNGTSQVIPEEPPKTVAQEKDKEEKEEEKEVSNASEERNPEEETNKIPPEEIKKSLLSIPDIFTEDVDEEMPSSPSSRSPAGTPSMKRRYSRSEEPVHYTELLHLAQLAAGENSDVDERASNEKPVIKVAKNVGETLEDGTSNETPINNSIKLSEHSIETGEPSNNNATVSVEVDCLVISSVSVNHGSTSQLPGLDIKKEVIICKPGEFLEQIETNKPLPKENQKEPLTLKTEKEVIPHTHQTVDEVKEKDVQDNPNSVINKESQFNENVCVEETKETTPVSENITTRSEVEEKYKVELDRKALKENTDKGKTIQTTSPKEVAFPGSNNTPLSNNQVFTDFTNVKAFDIRDTKGCRITGRRSTVFKDIKQEKNNVNRRSVSLVEQRRSFILGERSQSIADPEKKEYKITTDNHSSLDEGTTKDEVDNETESCVKTVAENGEDAKEHQENTPNVKEDEHHHKMTSQLNGGSPLDENENVNNVKGETKTNVTLTDDSNHKTPLVEIDGSRKKKKIKKGCGRCLLM